MNKVKFKCKGCGWTKELPEKWGSMSPRWCPTPTCEMSVKKSKGRKSFRTNPEMMEVTVVEEPKSKKSDVSVKTVTYQPKEQPSGKERRQHQQHRRTESAEQQTSSSQTGTVNSETPSSQTD